MRFLILFLLLYGCTEKIKPVNRNYFDISGFFKKEAARLNDAGTGIIKSVETNDSNEVQTFDSINWMYELRPFIECDINKPAWSNSYKTDTISDHDVLSVIYTATEDIPFKKVQIRVKAGVIHSVEIWKQRKNIYYNISEHYTYSPAGYTISGGQKVRFLDKTEFIISATFKS